METMYFINNYLNSYEITYEKIKNDLSIYIKTDLNIKKDYIYDEFLKQCVMKNFTKYNDGMVFDENKNIEIKREIVKKLKSIPLVEQKSKEWYEYRLNRITASNLSSLYNKGYKNRHNCLKDYVEKNLSFTPNVACNFGIKYEDVACNMYEQIKNVKVHEFGCLPHPNYDYLAASPDGITDDGVMLEIKCPYSRQTTGIPPIYYWYQMQLQLEVCDLNECDYLECNIKEYNNEEEFLRDNTVEYKGVLIKVNDKYEYYKGDICNYKQWLEEYENKYENIEISFWKCIKYYITRIYRDKVWFNNNVEIMKKFWDEVIYYRNNKEEYQKYLNSKTKVKVNKNNKKCIIFELEELEKEEETKTN